MKITKQKHQPIKLKVITVIVAIIVVGFIYFINFRHSSSEQQSLESSPAAQNTVPQESSEINSNTKSESTNPAANKTTDQIPVSSTLVVTFTDLSQSNGYIRFSGSTNDNTTDGNCSIVFTNPNDRPVSRTVNATREGDKAICGPVQIPETEFSLLGEWTATFRYYVRDTQAVTERKIIIR